MTERLRAEYPDRRPLLHFRSPYELVIGVILSAQTTDVQVNRVPPQLDERYPDARSLAGADPAEVETLVHSTGFYRTTARNIVGAARTIVERFDGAVPESMEDLVSIPGMGRKSANVIRGVIHGLPSIVVDTHLSRVTNRLGLVADAKPERIERALRSVVREPDQTDFSMGVNLHGRAVCTARAPRCPACVLADLCPWHHSRNA